MLKINNIDPNKVWFFSDPHYNHKNICRGVSNWPKDNMELFLAHTRDFSTLEEMNQTIVDNINNVVEEDSILFCLGDWSFGGIDSIWEFRSQINCKRTHLLLGNHDHHIERNKWIDNPKLYRQPENNLVPNAIQIQELFKSVNHYLEVEINYNKFVMCHYPIASWNNLRKGTIMLHGHLHTNNRGPGKIIDISMDGNNLKPYSLIEVLGISRNFPIGGFYNQDQDHHLVEE